MIGCAGVASLLFAISCQDGYSSALAWSPWLSELISDGPTTIFYIPMFRAFEFAIGALLLWMPAPGGRRNTEIALAAGLALIAYSVVFYDRRMLFPAANALPPCLGAALCIYGGRARLLGPALRNPFSVFVGKISYSVYLVHWPLLIFVRYYLFRAPKPAESAVLFLLSIALGYLSWRFVEQPFRHRGGLKWSNAAVIATAASLALNLALCGYVIFSEQGWSWRVSDEAKRIVDVRWDWNAEFTGSINCTDFCEFGDVANPKIIVIAGDSQSDQYTKMLAAMMPNQHFKLIQSGGCYIGADFTVRVTGWKYQHCRAAEDEMRKWLHDPRVSAVIHVQRWPSYVDLLQTLEGRPITFPDHIATYRAVIADEIKFYGGFRGAVLFVNSVPNTNLSCYIRPLYIPSLGCPIPPILEFADFAKMMRAAIDGKPRMGFVDPADTICTDGECEIATGGNPVYIDEIHLSVDGARLIVPKLLEALYQMDNRIFKRDGEP